MEIRGITSSFCVLLGIDWLAKGVVLNIYVLVCIFDIILFYHVILICDIEINQSINQSTNQSRFVSKMSVLSFKVKR